MRGINGVFWIISVCVFGVFAYMNWRYLDVQFLEYTMGDEFPQFLQLQKMYEGMLEFDIKKFFAFEFYNYGFLWYALNLLVVLPFKVYPNYEMAIYMPRMLNALFAIALLGVIYKIAKLYVNSRIALLFCIFAIAMPGFWRVGYLFKPDLFQALLLLCCVYCLCKDNFRFSKFYYYGIIFFGFAFGAAKFQAIMFLPLLYSYIFYIFISNPNIHTLLHVAKKITIATLSIFALWILTNPYLVHPRGFLAWLAMFKGNMNSNATNHGSYIDVSIMQKLSQVVDFYYFEFVVFVCLVFVCIALGILAFRMFFARTHTFQKHYIFIPVAVGFGVSILYLLLQVNKAWESYYFSSICLGILLFIPFVLVVDERFERMKLALGGGHLVCS